MTYEKMGCPLNELDYGDFLKCVKKEGWKMQYQKVNLQIKKLFPPFFWLSCLTVLIPFLRDYMACSVYAALRRGDR